MKDEYSSEYSDSGDSDYSPLEYDEKTIIKGKFAAKSECHAKKSSQKYPLPSLSPTIKTTVTSSSKKPRGRKPEYVRQHTDNRRGAMFFKLLGPFDISPLVIPDAFVELYGSDRISGRVILLIGGNSSVIVQAAKIGASSVLTTGRDNFIQSRPYLGVGTCLTFEVVVPDPKVW